MTKAVTAIVTNVMGDDPSDDFAGEDERVAEPKARKPKGEHRRQPDDQIHRSLLVGRFKRQPRAFQQPEDSVFERARDRFQ